MALDPDDLYQDIINDTEIMGDIPADAVDRVKTVFELLSVHITNQIKRGEVTTVVVETSNGVQNNVALVE
jgi:hypothetical protein